MAWKSDHRSRACIDRDGAACVARHWGDLLEAGVEIYEYQPTMFDRKVMVVDTLVWCRWVRRISTTALSA